MTINFRGYVYNDAGEAVSGASVKLLDTGTTTQEGSTVTTNSAGLWSFTDVSETDAPFDVEITKGTSVRRIRWDDQISLKEIDVRNDTAAGTPAATFTNLTNSASNQVAVFRNSNSTRADGDEIYLSFKLANSAGDIEEFARITAEAVDVTDGEEDGQLRFGVAKTNGTITDVFTINSTTGGDTSMTLDVSGDLTLDADGGDIFFKDGGTTFGSATNTGGNLIIKSGTTTALTFSGANVTAAGTIGSGAITSTGIVTGTGFTAGNAVLAEAELELLDGLTAGTAIASKVVTTDANIDTSGQRNLTITGELDAATLDISGNADIDGTLEADAITINGTAIGSIYGVIAGSSSIVTTGALDSGSITSGFGNINTGSSTITTTGAVATGALTTGTDGSGVDVIFYSGTSGDNLTWDASEEQLIITGTNGATSLNVADGNVAIADDLDVDGTTNLDAVDIDGAVQLDATLTVGANDQGYDIIFYGDTASANVTWDTSADDLIFNGAARIVVPDGQLVLGSTAVSSTAAELNLLDGVSGLVQADLTKLAAVDATAAELNLLDGSAKSTSSITIADADAFVVIDGTTTKQIPASDIKTYASGGATAADDIANGDGAVNILTTSGNITLDAQANDADVIIKVDDNGSAVTAVTFDGSDEGNAIFVNDVQLKSDGALLEFGADLDTTLTHTDGTGLTLNSTNKLTFGDAASFIQQSADGTLRIDGESIIDMNASTRVDISGTTTIGGSTVGYGTPALTVRKNQDTALTCDRTSDTGALIRLTIDGSEKGSIVCDASSTGYNTSSDYRLKENQTAISDGLTRVKALKPYRFNFKADAGVTRDGFFAHEAAAVVPASVTGAKDATDSNGDPAYQGMDNSKLVPILVAALKEIDARVTALE